MNDHFERISWPRQVVGAVLSFSSISMQRASTALIPTTHPAYPLYTQKYEQRLNNSREACHAAWGWKPPHFIYTASLMFAVAAAAALGAAAVLIGQALTRACF